MGSNQSTQPQTPFQKTNAKKPSPVSPLPSSLPRPTAPKNPQNVFDVYTLANTDSKEGTFGVVRTVTHKLTKQKRALKIIPKKTQESQNDQEKAVLKEIAVLRSLDHFAIVSVAEYFEDHKNFYIVMEFIEGTELFELIIDKESQNDNFEEKKAAAIIQKILKALCYMHGEGVVHRDVKPENIIVNDRCVKLVDFGSAVFYNKKNCLKEVAGSSYYVAPEVLEGEYNEKCDLWSVGVIMFVMLTGMLPFAGETDFEVLASVKTSNDFIEILAESSLSENAKNLIRNLLERKVEKRLSAEMALSHCWFDSVSFDCSRENESCFAFLDFGRTVKNRLHANFCAYVFQNTLNGKVIKNLENAFEQLDRNCDGYITNSDLSFFLRSNSINVSDSLKDNMIRRIQKNDLKMAFSEFCILCLKAEFFENEDNLLVCFEQVKNKSGDELSVGWVEAFLGCVSMRERLFCEKTVEKVGVANRTDLSFVEFKKLILKIIS